MQVTRQTLDTGWRVREVTPTKTPEHYRLPWLPAQVPGHVHLDLMRAGVIPDPFQRMYERAVAWVSESDWEYETTFTLDAPVRPHTYLLFHGLDTVAEIALNGEPLGRTDNMYIPHEFPLDGKLKAGENVLRVTFRSALRVGRERWDAWHTPDTPDVAPPHWDNWAERSFVRKAQYMYGWDWGPSLPSCGLWQPVELVTVPVARILDWKYDVEFTKDGKAIVTVEAEVERNPNIADAPLTMTAGVEQMLRWMSEGGCQTKGLRPAVQSAPVPVGAGRQSVSLSINVEDPVRWEPSGLGETWQYSYTMQLHADNEGSIIIDQKSVSLGLRTIELIREADADGNGEGFQFRVNGNDTFIKGANWIPNHSFPSLIDEDSLFTRIRQARDMGFNMLRVWGGGLYETEQFYDICDGLGILVWQDFPYACALYPDTGEYAKAARAEATAAVKRIRNHPSLALWCGNNENDWFFTREDDPKRHRFIGEKLYHDILPAVVAAEDPKTAYWPSSPYGGPRGDANNPNFGDCHNWDVWHGRGDWVHYTENDSRFCSEFGFASSCGLGAWDKCLAPEDKHPHSPAVRWHDKTRKGYDTYLGYIGLHYPDPQTLEDLVYYSQINQAEALKYGIEHYRRRKGRCWGTLFWQINDCWPVQSWAVIDSEGEPKAAWYWARKFFAPILLSLVRRPDHVEAHLVSDLLQPLEGELTLAVETFDGEPLASQTSQVSVGENSAAMVAMLSRAAALGREREVYVYAKFAPRSGKPPVENLILLAEPKELRLASPGLAVAVSEENGDFAVTLTARRFAPYLWLRRADNQPLFPRYATDIGDNFFHLRPGQSRKLLIPSSEGRKSAEALRGQLVVRTL